MIGMDSEMKMGLEKSQREEVIYKMKGEGERWVERKGELGEVA